MQRVVGRALTHTIVDNYQQSSTAHLDIKSSHKMNENYSHSMLYIHTK